MRWPLIGCVVCKVLILLTLSGFFGPTVASASSCNSLFELAKTSLKPDEIQSQDQLQSYALRLIKENTDIMSLIWALQESEVARYWRNDDVLIFLRYLERQHNVKISNADFPYKNPKFQNYKAIKNEFDYIKFILANLLLGKSKDSIVSEVKKSPYVIGLKKRYYADADINRAIEDTYLEYKSIKDLFQDKNRFTEFDRIFDLQSGRLKTSSKLALTKVERNQAYTSLLMGDGVSRPDLRIAWVVDRPENIFNFGESYWRLRSNGKATTFHINPFSERPYSALNKTMGLPGADQRFFENVYKNYEDKIKVEVIDQVKNTEEKLPNWRQSYGLVFADYSASRLNEVVGTIRVFDGTPKRADDLFFMTWYTDISPILPFETIFNSRGISVQYINTIKQIRNADPYAHIFELGKLSLEGSPEVRDRALKAIELFLYDYYLTRYPNALFIIHAAGGAHLKLYQKRYGFKLQESVYIPESNTTEYILILDGPGFKKALERRLGLSKSD